MVLSLLHRKLRRRIGYEDVDFMFEFPSFLRQLTDDYNNPIRASILGAASSCGWSKVCRGIEKASIQDSSCWGEWCFVCAACVCF